MPRGRPSACLFAAMLPALAACLALSSCASDKPKPQARVVPPPVVRDVPEPLRGTIGTQAILLGVDPVLVSGFGLVVGLNGTGGGPYREDIQATMEQELARMRVSTGSTLFAGTPFDGLTPREVLRRKDVAIVIVQAAVAPGSPVGSEFDAFVYALPNSGVTSLEGGTLWTTELRLGAPSVFGSQQAKILATARGPLFINPFAEPGMESAGITRTAGRILGGGKVTEPLEIAIRLDNPYHSVARSMVGSINSRFPPGPGDRGPTANGKNAEIIGLKVPAAYRQRPQEFINLVKHLNTDYLYPQESARRYTEALKKEPYLAVELSYCLEAVGEPAKGFIRPLYDYPEISPRMAALRAGAGLGDVQAAPPLKELAVSGPDGLRGEAIRLLSGLDAGPSVDKTLRDLLASPELDVFVAAYEGLAERAERTQLARLIRATGEVARYEDPSAVYHRLNAMSRIDIPGDTLQGIERRPMARKFLLDLVPGGQPTVYISQHGRPRIALFGNPQLRRPLLASVWSNRLLLRSESPTDDIHIYYRAPDGEDGRMGGIIANDLTVRGGLVELIETMAHRPTPESPRPGLNLTYSEVVGALSALCEAGAIDAAFATERDRLAALLFKATSTSLTGDRPAVSSEPQAPEGELTVPPAPGAAITVPAEPRSIIVPIIRRPAPSK